ncbi:hypothetical protein [Corynebacterium sp. 13CS0277]|uniref:hypothetical protein n=1 Tax=Corynebacterium sp. 13CS0277 TaxID=2071994 RepID=UPI001304CD37|nr:hypothetical protein [Corynebacterium sp. 13CS0277]
MADALNRRFTPTPTFAALALAALYEELDKQPLRGVSARRLRAVDEHLAGPGAVAEAYRAAHARHRAGRPGDDHELLLCGEEHTRLAAWVLAGHARNYPSKKLQGRVRATTWDALAAEGITLPEDQRAAITPAIIGWSLAGQAHRSTGDMVVHWALDYPDDTIACAYHQLTSHILFLAELPHEQRNEIALGAVLVRLLGLVDALAGWPGRSAEATKILSDAFGAQAGPVRLAYWENFLEVVHFRNAFTHLNSGGDPSYLDAVRHLGKESGWHKVVDAARPITAWMGAAIAMETRAADSVPHTSWAKVHHDLQEFLR